MQWFIFILIIQVIHGLGTWKLYIKAGRQAWEAFVPAYNGIVLMKIINRPWWWVILLFLPIVNLIMFAVVWVEFSVLPRTVREYEIEKFPLFRHVLSIVKPHNVLREFENSRAFS